MKNLINFTPRISWFVMLLVIIFCIGLSAMSTLTWAHGDTIVPPQSLPITMAGGQDNHNNRDDNLKHFSEAVIITATVICIMNKCWKPHEPIKFTTATRISDEH